MPVRSSVCTYSPSVPSNSSKYSSLSIGQYKPLSSATLTRGSTRPSSCALSSASLTGSSSLRSPIQLRAPSSSSRYSVSSASSISSASSYSSSSSSSSSSGSSYSPLNGYSSSSYSPSSANTNPVSSTIGYYKTLTSGPGSLLSSTASSRHALAGSGSLARPSDSYHQLTSSRYSSGSSLSSASSDYLASRGATGDLSSGYSSSVSQPDQPPLPANLPRGLVNLGNTCYMNSVLQALYSVDSFRSLVVGPSSKLNSAKTLTSELSQLFRSLRPTDCSNLAAPGQRTPLSPANFKYAFASHQAKFAGLGQQDAQEFLRYLINGIHEESNVASRRPRRCTSPRAPESAREAWAQYRDIVDDSPLVDLLVGQLCSTIVCGECQHKSHCWDPFWDLSLPLIRGRYSLKLSDILEEFTSRETLDSDERPVCCHCKRATKSTKQISLARLPQVLILHLKKFTNDGYKLTSPQVTIDTQLTFNGATSYHLRASISHHGHSATSGHYTSHCAYAGRWFHFNDELVRELTPASSISSKLDDAYVLIYTQQQPGASSSSRRSSLVTTSGHHQSSKL